MKSNILKFNSTQFSTQEGFLGVENKKTHPVKVNSSHEASSRPQEKQFIKADLTGMGMNFFYGFIHKDFITLHFEVEKSNQDKGFVLEHHHDGQKWNLASDHLSVHFAHSSQKEHHHYYHVEIKRLEPGHHFFRIKNHKDEQHSHHPALAIEVNVDKTHHLVTILPNLLHQDFHIALKLEKTQKVALHLLNEEGNVIKPIFEGTLANNTIHSLIHSFEDEANNHSIIIEGETFYHHFSLSHRKG